MKNFNWLVYTYKHRRTFEHLVETLDLSDELREKMRQRAKIHDVDKLLMYMFLPQVESQSYHVMHKAHHLDNDLNRTYEDYVETIIDFESAPYTKPDKPLNAYDFVKFILEREWITKETADILFAIMKDLKIDYSYDITKNEEAMSFVDSIGEVTQEMILLEVLEHMDILQEELSYIKERTGEC